MKEIIGDNLKDILFKQILAELDQQSDELNKMLKSISSDKANETKSVVGDKHETSRVLLQNEEDLLVKRVKIHSNNRKKLKADFKKKATDKIQSGSLVQTDKGCFLLSIPFGKVVCEGLKVFCLSVDAPLGQKLVGVDKGAIVVFNGRKYMIQEIS